MSGRVAFSDPHRSATPTEEEHCSDSGGEERGSEQLPVAAAHQAQSSAAVVAAVGVACVRGLAVRPPAVA